MFVKLKKRKRGYYYLPYRVGYVTSGEVPGLGYSTMVYWRPNTNHILRYF